MFIYSNHDIFRHNFDKPRVKARVTINYLKVQGSSKKHKAQPLKRAIRGTLVPVHKCMQ